MKKYVKLTAVMALMVSMMMLMTACEFSLFGPSNATGVMKKYSNQVKGVKNFHIDGDMDMQMVMKFDEATASLLGTTSFDMPVTATFGLDVGEKSAHGDMDMKLSIMGMNQEQESEMYIDAEDGCVYMKDEATDTWTKTATDKSLTSFVQLEDMGDMDWSKFDFEKTDDGYKIKASMKDIDGNFFGDSLTGNLGDTVADLEVGDEGEVAYYFDKKCNLTKAEVTGVTATGKEEGFEVEMTIDMHYTLSKYNELDEDDYEIPSKVKKEAVEDSGDDGLMEGLGGETPVEPVTPTTPATPAEPANPAASGKGTILSGETLDEADRTNFTVGQDIKPGTYKLYMIEGPGVCSIYDSQTFEKNYGFSFGHGNADDTKDGVEVVLEADDEIYITDDLTLEFR